LDELSNAKDECKKNRFAKRPRSPDKSIWEAPAVFDDKDKNEIEKMFERFGIKASAGDDNSDDDDGVSVRKSDQMELNQNETFASPSHIYSEQSKLLQDTSETSYDNQNLAYEQDDFLYVRTSTTCDVNTIKAGMSESNKEVVMIDDNVFGIVRLKEPVEVSDKDKKKKTKKDKKERQGKSKSSLIKEKLQLGERDIAKFKNQPLTLPIGESSGGTKIGQENVSRPSLGSVSPVFEADIGEAGTDNLPAVHGSCLNNIVFDNPGESSTDVLSTFSDLGSAVDNLGLSVSDLGPPSSALWPDVSVFLCL